MPNTSFQRSAFRVATPITLTDVTTSRIDITTANDNSAFRHDFLINRLIGTSRLRAIIMPPPRERWPAPRMSMHDATSRYHFLATCIRSSRQQIATHCHLRIIFRHSTTRLLISLHFRIAGITTLTPQPMHNKSVSRIAEEFRVGYTMPAIERAPISYEFNLLTFNVPITISNAQNGAPTPYHAHQSSVIYRYHASESLTLAYH